MIQVMSFEVSRESITMFYDGVGWIVYDGEFKQYHKNFEQASEAMDDLIMKMLGREE